MAGLTDLMNYQSPFVGKEQRDVYNPGAGAGDTRQTQERLVVGGGGQLSGGKDPLGDILEGYDEESDALMGKLRSIYDGYTGSYNEMEGNIRPIMDMIEQDITKFEDYIGDYEGLVSGMEGDFLDSIVIDPSATRTRGEYMGNVAAQYDQAEAAQRRQAIQQGQNPYDNRGAKRSMALERAGAMAGAANTAHKDWREAYNRDIQSQQQANEAYAGLVGRQGDMRSNLLAARGGLISTEKGLLDSKLTADQARAAGYEGLTGLTENRRQQAIELGQKQAEAGRLAKSETNQLKASLPGQTWYNPEWNAGGSQQWS